MTPKTAAPVPLEVEISRSLRREALARIRSDGISPDALAERLGIFPTAAETLVLRADWPLDVAVRVVSALGIRIRIDAISEAG